MTDKNAEAGPAQDSTQNTDPSQVDLQYDVEHRDWVLQMLVGICNLSGLEVSVTLNLKGSYVSGHIVKPDVYFEGLKADFNAATFGGNSPSKDIATFKEMLEHSLSSMKELSTPNPKDEGTLGSDIRTLRPRYVHLRGARFFMPNDIPRSLYAVKGLWWRGKIESVDGFYFGMPFFPS